jgi:hypothetical protein
MGQRAWGSSTKLTGERFGSNQPLSNPDKPKITNYKHQITNKSQIPMPNDQNIGWNFEFRSL